MSQPACFNSQEEYSEWRRHALAAREHCTPCSDCTAEYRQRMTEADRCKPAYVKAHYVMFPRKEVQVPA